MGKLFVTLAGRVGPEGAGLVMAEHRGYFADEGLDVLVRAPGSPLSPAEYVRQGEDEIGVVQQPQLVLEREQGAPLAAFGSVIPEPTAALIWLEDSKIDGIADLEGKTIAIPGLPFQRSFLEVVLARGGLTLEDVKVKAVEYELVSSLVEGRADAIFGGSRNIEGIELESRGLDPVVTPVSSLGVPPYEEQVLIARTDFIARYPQAIRDFMSALRRGTAAAIKNPKAAARVLDSSIESTSETGREEMEAEVEATLPLLSKTGQMSPGKESRLADWMDAQGQIP